MKKKLVVTLLCGMMAINTTGAVASAATMTQTPNAQMSEFKNPENEVPEKPEMPEDAQKEGPCENPNTNQYMKPRDGMFEPKPEKSEENNPQTDNTENSVNFGAPSEIDFNQEVGPNQNQEQKEAENQTENNCERPKKHRRKNNGKQTPRSDMRPEFEANANKIDMQTGEPSGGMAPKEGKMQNNQMPQNLNETNEQLEPQKQGGQMPPEGQKGKPNEQFGQPGQTDNHAPTEYSATISAEEDISEQTIKATENNQSAIVADGKTLSIKGTTVSKTGDSDAEDADFYGTNAGILAINGSELTISDADITTDGKHANAVFSYGDSKINISNSKITTSGNNSGGLMTTGGATMEAKNLDVSTSGNSSAAIRSDRGGGTVTVEEGSYKTSGVGSPAIYSTADITVSDATLSAGDSEAVVIEGGNSVTLKDVNITGNNKTLNGQSTMNTNVLIYQSMSGDASEGSSRFTMDGGTMKSETGCMFHVTNTTTTIDLSNVTFESASNEFLNVSADAWGNEGANGGHVTLNLNNQDVSGDIHVDEISELSMNINGGSYTGAINSDGTVSVNIENGTWTLTGDSSISEFSGNKNAINTNGYHLYINGEEFKN